MAEPDADGSLRGQLLIASPALVDPNFARSVVLITEHGPDGAMGVVLNRPSETEVSEVATELEDVAGSEPVFIGGPVQPQALVVLGADSLSKELISETLSVIIKYDRDAESSSTIYASTPRIPSQINLNVKVPGLQALDSGATFMYLWQPGAVR